MLNWGHVKRTHHNNSLFDGERGLVLQSLSGCRGLWHGHAHLADYTAKPSAIPRAIAIFERYAGPEYRHQEMG